MGTVLTAAATMVVGAPLEERNIAKRYSGQATYYTQGGNAGACGNVNSDSAYIVAVNSGLFDSSKCGQSVTVTNQNNGQSNPSIIHLPIPPQSSGISAPTPAQANSTQPTKTQRIKYASQARIASSRIASHRKTGEANDKAQTNQAYVIFSGSNGATFVLSTTPVPSEATAGAEGVDVLGEVVFSVPGTFVTPESCFFKSARRRASAWMSWTCLLLWV